MLLNAFPTRMLILATVILSGLFACQNPATFFVGRPVEPILQIPITTAPTQNGVWQTFDLVINYTLYNNDDQIEVTGRAELGEHYQRLYNRVTQLDLYLFLLDGNAAVLKTIPLNGSLLRSTGEEITINTTVLKPVGLKALSFGYRGSVTSLDSHTSFDELP
mgnify:CR=1 FL=1